jgi:hypothetical protein
MMRPSILELLGFSMLILLAMGWDPTMTGPQGPPRSLWRDRPDATSKAEAPPVRRREYNPTDLPEGRARILQSIKTTQWNFKLPPEMTRWEEILRQPGQSYAEQLTRAYYFGLEAKPIVAFRALLDGTLKRDEADSTYGRRLELIALTLRPNPVANGDRLLADVVGALRSWRDGDRLDLALGLFASARPLLARRALEKVRADRLSAEVAAQFALATPDRPMVPLLVVALGRDSSTARAYFWGVSDLCSPDDTLARKAFERLSEESELTAADLQPFYQTLSRIAVVDENVMTRRLAEELDLRLDRLQQLPGARGLDRDSLKFLTGVRGKSMEADLAKLTDAKQFASLERSLATPPRRLGRGR